MPESPGIDAMTLRARVTRTSGVFKDDYSLSELAAFLAIITNNASATLVWTVTRFKVEYK